MKINILTDKITFGKYTGKTFEEIADLNPSYILWLSDNTELKFPKSWKDAVEMDAREQEEWIDQWEFFNAVSGDERYYGQS